MAHTPRDARFGAPKILLPTGSWSYIIDLYEAEYPSSMIFLDFEIADGIGNLRAQVASETAKAYLIKLFKQHPSVKHLEADVTVTAPFRSAQRDPFDIAFDSWDGQSADPLLESGVTLLRYPAIEMIGERRVGETIVIIVRLENEPDQWTVGEPTTIEGVPETWKQIDVDVVLHSAQLDIDATTARETVIIRRDQDCTPAFFQARILPEAAKAGEIQIDVHFFYESRRCGAAKRTMLLTFEQTGTSIEGSGKMNKAEQTQPSPHHEATAPKNFTLPTQIQPGLEASELTIIIDRQGSGVNEQYRWSTYSRVAGEGKLTTVGPLDLHGSGREFAWKLVENFNNLPAGGHERTVKGVGRKIWEATPGNFQTHYLDLVARRGTGFPIQIFSDEPYVPWEMMLPADPTGSRDYDHLFIQHPIARWPLSTSRRAPTEFKVGMLASFVPTYTSRFLLAAKEEGTWLCERLGAVAQSPSYDEFLNFLEKPPEATSVQIVHFAGHGTISDAEPASIEMLDEKFVTVDEVRQPGIKLGHRDRSLFVLNACEVGSTSIELGLVIGWADALIGNAFGGVIAPLWQVKDEYASAMIKTTLERFLRQSETIGEALRVAREESRSSSTTPFSYVLYGDVMARSNGGTAIKS
ncbi:CHAT domain-containing protein [Rhizobium azibense]|uniref:CHAT domain-containing protein n=1 Tax=Rhizobium azibense TaxID=1136135 RepID=A0A4R3RHC3_9HYPH|nr:CHAT domain-containing protein [Rhizobium azibense]TCU32892.1 CHAT domain-containing protein [Rhizobium azibense]